MCMPDAIMCNLLIKFMTKVMELKSLVIYSDTNRIIFCLFIDVVMPGAVILDLSFI